ncbi:MAG: sulfate permease [Flavobacteriaceae bacterium]|nr:sulfate permease [Flavobacteriaceae bacterium]MDG2386914.1 sulfate permease [Flavobacteriaceae bacterium]
MKNYFPFLDWISNYRSAYFKRDLFAGLTVAVLLIPQGMAYALIAGLPPIYGLYAALTPQIIYAFLGTSRQLAVGPVAMDSLLVAAGLGALSITDPSQYVQMAILLALLMGGIQLLLGLLRMGFIVSFLSKPVISGFTSAAAIIIGFSQLKHLLGIQLSQSNQLHIVIESLIQSKVPIHFDTLIIGILSVFLILVFKNWNRKIPSALIVVVLGISWVYFNGLDNEGVAVVGFIPEGLPSFQTPLFEAHTIKQLFPTALTLALVAFMEAISVAKAIEEKHKDYTINPNQELIALGSANIMGSFFQSYPTTGGFSRTAVNDQAGAKTGMAALITALIVALILMFFTNWFYYLPKVVLASIIIVAVINLIDLKFAIRLYTKRKDEFTILIVTFLATLFLGITEGIVLGVVISLLLLVYRASKPHHAFLGRIGTTNYFKNINRFPDEVVHRDDLIILRFDAQLFFGNIQYFKELVTRAIEEKETTVKGFVINARAINYIDSTASEQLYELIQSIQQKGIRVMVVGAIGPARDLLIKSKIIKILKKQNLFITSGDATDDFDGVTKKTPLQKKLSRQSNP